MVVFYDRNRKLFFQVFSICCFIAVLTCIIVNVAIDRRITWSAYVILSVAFGWLVVSPVFIRKYGIVLSLCSIMLYVLPYLLLLEKITPVDGWFMPLGLPSGIIGIIAMWVFYLLFRFVRISPWFKAAIVVFICGAAINPLIQRYTDSFLNETQPFFLRVINYAAYVAVTVALVIIGVKRRRCREPNY
ncbi:MAG: DUF6320 domain-containing protein [Oscillospiraceae bacterium]|nr:DUF6320 domain-containing protein [Oscillospiraceae bacterium]